MFSSRNEGIFNQYRRLISWLQKLLDGVVVVLLLFFLCCMCTVTFQQYYLILGAITFLLTMVVFEGAQLYRPWRGVNLGRLVRRVFIAWGLIAAFLLALCVVTKTSILFSRGVLVPWLILTPFALVTLRLMVYLSLRWVRAHGLNTRTAIIGGAGTLGRRLAKSMKDTAWLGMNLKGFFDDFTECGEIELQPGGKRYPILGNLDSMADYVRAEKIDMVYLALPLRAEERIREAVDALQDTTASVYFVPDVFAFSLFQASITDLRGIPLISLWETPFYAINGWLKRAEDIFLLTLILLLVSPLMLFIALAIKLSSPGPIIFKQRRYGLNGHEITVYKFRTMNVWEDRPEVQQAILNDQRVTCLGRLLRRTSLDELPQFFNVLQGTMSIVGPRPHAVAHNEYYRRLIPSYMLRHKVRPGLTGWAQVNGWRGETETLEKMEKRVEYDLEYLRRWSLWFDLKIITLTIFRGLFNSRAY